MTFSRDQEIKFLKFANLNLLVLAQKTISRVDTKIIKHFRDVTVKLCEYINTSKTSSFIHYRAVNSVLGPLLFVIYINDLPEAINSDSFLFADDTKVFREITSKDDPFALQSDIDSLQHWSNKWLLQFHLDKCHVLTLGKFDNIRYTRRYSIYEHELEHVFEEKDLGLTFESDLKIDEHISAKVRKANAIVGLIRRTFSFLDCRMFKKLYTTFVRPHLEYAPRLCGHLTLKRTLTFWKMYKLGQPKLSMAWPILTTLNLICRHSYIEELVAI